ncbi:MAG: hypothetical protein CSA66_05350 [Proteobacteria bacterium]|nr:MAG: hypothetical protein CSA66_05350 [Pseudomonadota bacterium]
MNAADRLATLLSVAGLLGACASTPAPPPPASAAAAPALTSADPLAEVSLPALPLWTDKYADPDAGSPRYLDIDAVMARHGLTRWQAVEVQNHYRDQADVGAPGGPEAWYAEAVRRVRAGDYESGYDAERIGSAPFVVVFDLDETLYDQRVRAEAGCHDLVATQPSGKRRRIKLVPGWQDALARLHALGGAVVLFSANLDAPTLANLTAWTWGGVPIRDRPEIAAVMTNSYLIMQSKAAGDPISRPSKDLRLFDESLSKVIIVDNMPLRIFHHANTRRFHEFQADERCGADPAMAAAIDGALPEVVREVEDSLAWMKAHGGTFAEAYRPFTMLGQDVVRVLVDGGLSEAEAVTYVREHPESVRDAF